LNRPRSESRRARLVTRAFEKYPSGVAYGFSQVLDPGCWRRAGGRLRRESFGRRSGERFARDANIVEKWAGADLKFEVYRSFRGLFVPFWCYYEYFVT
jgi:hypothetical protein